MDMDLLKNGSGIKDPTAYKAIKSLEGDNVKEFTNVEYLDIKSKLDDDEKKSLMDDIQDLQDELANLEEMYKNEKSICHSLQKDLEAAAAEREEYKKRIEELTVMLDCERANTIENSHEINAAKYIVEKYERMFEIMFRKVGA